MRVVLGWPTNGNGLGGVEMCCCRCGRRVFAQAEDVVEMVERAVADGWLRLSGRAVCGQCVTADEQKAADLFGGRK